MTVAELIEKLKTFPPDAPVIYQAFSDYSALEADQVYMETLNIRGRKYCGPYPPEWFPDDETPVTKPVCVFPGN